VYIDDIIVASNTFEEHVQHLALLLKKLDNYNIKLEPKKSYVGFPSVTLLSQRVDSLGITTLDEKPKGVLSLAFPNTLKQLETYLRLTGCFRRYVLHYAQLAARKNVLL
jgi:hypothetical protein